MLNMVDGHAGKGDSYRKVDPGKFRNNFDKIFSKKKKKPAPKTNEHKGHKTGRA